MRNDITTYQYGNTIRFQADFKDFNDNATDPQEVKLIIYDERYNVIFDSSDININPEGNTHASPSSLGTGTGRFILDFTTPRKDQRLFYEWSGLLDGKISLQRGEFNTRFLR